MSAITIYNDGSKDAQIVVLNYLTPKPGVHYALPMGEDHPAVDVDLGNGDIIIITLADAATQAAVLAEQEAKG